MRSMLIYGDSNTFGQTTADTPTTAIVNRTVAGVLRSHLGAGWLCSRKD